MATLLICPRCKESCLNPRSYGESALYRSRHRLCVPCFHDEDAEIEHEGTNNLPERLQAYGPENDYEKGAMRKIRQTSGEAVVRYEPKGLINGCVTVAFPTLNNLVLRLTLEDAETLGEALIQTVRSAERAS